MKRIILNFEKKTKNFNELVQEAFNKDFLNFLVSEETNLAFGKIERANIYSKILNISPKYVIYEDKDELIKKITTDELLGNIGFYKGLKSKEDEKEIINLSKTGQLDFIIVSAKDWKIIPFENLIAQMHLNDTELIADVTSVNEAEIMLKTLEIGVDGVLIAPRTPNDIVELKKLITTTFKVELTKGKVTRVQNIPEGERVCVDTTSILSQGEGMLVGSTAAGFCLIHSETFETQFVAARPFRVNAGDVSAYVLVPSDDPNSSEIYRTKYLSELKGGDKVLIVNVKGETRIVSVGRIKIETRPMLRFELEAFKGDKRVPINCVCQNAETIHLVDTSGNAKSVVDIRIGTELLVHVGPGATHFGTAIKETIIEK